MDEKMMQRTERGIEMILAEIDVPAMGSKYDVRLDENTPVAHILEELGSFLIPGKEEQNLWLCSYDYERILPFDRTLWQTGIGDGARLLLV